MKTTLATGPASCIVVMAMLAAGCAPRTDSRVEDDAPRQAPAATSSSVGLTFTSKHDLLVFQEARGFVLHGRFENGKWPARVVYEKQAIDEIQFVLKSGTPHRYPDNKGYCLRVVALEDESGGESVFVFRSGPPQRRDASNQSRIQSANRATQGHSSATSAAK